jgi:hypothetical protein
MNSHSLDEFALDEFALDEFDASADDSDASAMRSSSTQAALPVSTTNQSALQSNVAAIDLLSTDL